MQWLVAPTPLRVPVAVDEIKQRILGLLESLDVEPVRV
jgi:hypothetical protein